MKNIAIIGYGGMGSYHAQLITKQLSFMKLAGIYDIDANRTIEAIANGIKAYDSLECVLTDDSIDIVLIATPNDSHKDIAVNAFRAGKHVICEKPVAMSSVEHEAMQAAATENGRIFAVHQNRRWDADYCTIKKIYEENILNEIYHVESRVHGSRGIPGDWRGTSAQGGGMLLDWGVHIIDQMLLMIQERIKSVFCRFTHITNVEVDDGFSLLLTFESGKTALLEVGTHHFLELPRWYMVGRDGTARIDDFDVKGCLVKVKSWEDKDVKPIRTGAGMTKTMAPRTADTVEMLELPMLRPDVHEFYQNVADTIDGNADLIVTYEQVQRVMKLMEAAFLSDRKGQVVEFE